MSRIPNTALNFVYFLLKKSPNFRIFARVPLAKNSYLEHQKKPKIKPTKYNWRHVEAGESNLERREEETNVRPEGIVDNPPGQRQQRLFQTLTQVLKRRPWSWTCKLKSLQKRQEQLLHSLLWSWIPTMQVSQIWNGVKILEQSSGTETGALILDLGLGPRKYISGTELKILQRSDAAFLHLQPRRQPEAFVINLKRSCQPCKPKEAAGLDHDPGPEKKNVSLELKSLQKRQEQLLHSLLWYWIYTN
jgi:hypothetical protein